MGPGVDLDLLRTYFDATGSDASQVFIERYLATHPNASVLKLDAVTLDTDRRFDAILSNKDLHHLNPTEQPHSFQRQAAIADALSVGTIELSKISRQSLSVDLRPSHQKAYRPLLELSSLLLDLGHNN